MFYSKSTGGFYSREIHGNNIPTDAVEISEESYKSLLEGESQGFVIATNSDGVPFLEEKPPPNSSEVQAALNITLREYLSSTDWYVIRKIETGVDIPKDISTKRAAARKGIIE